MTLFLKLLVEKQSSCNMIPAVDWRAILVNWKNGPNQVRFHHRKLLHKIAKVMMHLRDIDHLFTLQGSGIKFARKLLLIDSAV